MVELDALGIRSYVAEPADGRRDRSKQPEAQAPLSANRRRIRGRRGRRLMRRRGEYVDRTFAHVYDTGRMRRTHLRGHTNILKRVLIQVAGFNLGLVMRQLIGLGRRVACRAGERRSWPSSSDCGRASSSAGAAVRRPPSIARLAFTPGYHFELLLVDASTGAF
jgi:hypothetical protein